MHARASIRIALILTLALALAAIPAAIPAAAQAPQHAPLTPQQQRQLLVQAKQAYYNLHTSGASGVVTCQAVMQWDNHWPTQDSTLPHNPHADQMAAALKTVTFKVTLHTDNSIEATPLNLPTLADPKDAGYQEEIVARMRGALRVVLQGWARYEIRAAFERPDIQSSVADLGAHYAVVYKAFGEQEDITMSRDFLIDSIHFKGVVNETATSHPRFTPTPAGFLVTAWDTTVTGRFALSVSATVTYADVQGIHLPSTIVATYKPAHPGARITLTLSNYQFRKL